MPITQLQAVRYVAHLSLHLSATSLPMYLNIIWRIHWEQGLPDPEVMKMFDLREVITGIGKDKGLMVKRIKP